MKKVIPILILSSLISACGGWFLPPIQQQPTPFLPPTQTPSIFTSTPIVVAASPTATVEAFTPTITATATLGNTETPTITFTVQAGAPAVALQILGCDTSIDISHGMGEVTNAYITLTNNGGVELTNLRVTLFALDEDREHPDKTIELTSLPINNIVTLKLTVDSSYREESAIQVEVITDQGTFPREGSASCRDIGLFAPNPSGLYTPVPVVP